MAVAIAALAVLSLLASAFAFNRHRGLLEVRAELAAERRRATLVMGAINESYYDWNVATDEIFYSDSMERVLGLPQNALKTTGDWRRRIHPDDLAATWLPSPNISRAGPSASARNIASAGTTAAGAGRASTASPSATPAAARSA